MDLSNLSTADLLLIFAAASAFIGSIVVSSANYRRGKADAEKVTADAKAIVSAAKTASENASIAASQSVVQMLHGEILALQQRITALESRAEAGQSRFDALSVQYQQSLLKVVTLEVEITQLKREVANLRAALGSGQGGMLGMEAADRILPAGTGIEGKEMEMATAKAEAVVSAPTPEQAKAATSYE